MKHHDTTISSILSVVVFALLAWFVTLAIVQFSVPFGGVIRVMVHWAASIFVFGSAFVVYYYYHRFADPFATASVVLLTYIVTEVIFWNFVQFGQCPYTHGFLDWIAPFFFMVTTIYLVGTFYRGSGRT